MNKMFMEWDNGLVLPEDIYVRGYDIDMSTYNGNPIKESTIKHAIQYLKQTEEEIDTTAATCYSAFEHVVGGVKFPCRAVGVARRVLEMHSWDVNEAIKYLEN